MRSHNVYKLYLFITFHLQNIYLVSELLSNYTLFQMGMKQFQVLGSLPMKK